MTPAEMLARYRRAGAPVPTDGAAADMLAHEGHDVDAWWRHSPGKRKTEAKRLLDLGWLDAKEKKAAADDR